VVMKGAGDRGQVGLQCRPQTARRGRGSPHDDPPRCAAEAPRLVGKGQPGPRRPADFTALPGPGSCGARDLARGWVRSARTTTRSTAASRRSYIDMVIPPHRSVHRAPGKHVCPVSCSTPGCGGTRTRRRPSGHGRTPYRVRAQPQEVIPTAGADASRPRTLVGLNRGQHLPGKPDPRAALLLRPARLASLPDAIQPYMCGSATHPGGGIMGAPGGWPARSSRTGSGAVREPRRGIIGGGQRPLVTAALRQERALLVLECDVVGAPL
jgi:hypothetical protein